MKFPVNYKKRLRIPFYNMPFYCIITIVFCLGANTCSALEKHPDFSYYEEIEKRNIFRPKIEPEETADEKQKPEELPPPVETPPEIDHFVLTGIVNIRGKFKATITNTKNQQGYYVGTHDLVEDFYVKDIRNDIVILERGGEVSELRLNTPASPDPKENIMVDEGSEPNALPQAQTQRPDNDMRYKTNMMKSIRLGIPNAPKD